MKRSLAALLILAWATAACASPPPGERPPAAAASSATDGSTAASAASGAPKPAADGSVAGIAPGIVGGEAAHRLAAAGVKIVDVRTKDEFGAGHVPGAVNIPFQQMAERFREVGPPTTPVLLYCQSGRRSGIAAQVLRDKGFKRIFDLQSYDRWVRAEPVGEPPR